MGNQGSKKAQGGNNNQPAKTNTPPPQSSQKQKAIKIQKTMLVLDRQIKQFQDRQKKSQVQIDQLKAKAKQLIEMNKKVDAKKYLQQATRIKKQSENYSTRRKVLQNKKFQLQQAMMDKQTVGALGEAQQHLKDQERINDQLQNIIYQTNQQKMVQQQLNDKLKDLADVDELEDDVDDLLAELEGQVKKEKQKKLPQKIVATNVNTQQKSKQKEQDDQISKMMAEL